MSAQRWIRGLLVGLVGLTVGCERSPLDCPGVSPGALVITEIRPEQGGDTDTQGEWIELFNASGGTIELLGARVELTTLTGGSTQEFTVRSPLSVGAGQYVTFGRFAEGEEPAHIDYGYAGDLDSDLLDIAAIQVVICGAEVDQAIYRGLPDSGSLALDGASAPDAVFNDDEMNFCVDAAGAGEGTPQQENPPCN